MVMSFKNDESMQSSVSSEGKPGNFLALLRLLVIEFCDMVLKEHLSSAPKMLNISHLQFKMT